jgi:hypothetical protein
MLVDPDLVRAGILEKHAEPGFGIFAGSKPDKINTPSL